MQTKKKKKKERRPGMNVYTTGLYLLDVAMARLTLHKGRQSYNK